MLADTDRHQWNRYHTAREHDAKEVRGLMMTLPPPGTALGTITGYGYEFAATAKVDAMARTRMSTRGLTHTTGQLAEDAAQHTFIAEGHAEAYPRIEPDSLLSMQLLDSARQRRMAVATAASAPRSASSAGISAKARNCCSTRTMLVSTTRTRVQCSLWSARRWRCGGASWISRSSPLG
ncbi:hypothetical protein LO763_21965 [Glycomyces sp. A-F 0318]|uniref:hypothetical protein n=1 Tax=Glycomyces amatae TaxID=2881355 RepID=UPI001E31EED0|nr:hypothetical protein [Glycomyces amatae]MCD0446283.1 hypothetical protein [Glycomyces amatae]